MTCDNKRKAAMAMYTPPFTYECGYIFDSQHLMVSDNGPVGSSTSVKGAVAARVRGWGRLTYLPNGAELQDEIGQMMADALNTMYATVAQPAINDADIEAAAREHFNPAINWDDPANLGVSAVRSRAYFKSGAKWALSKVAPPAIKEPK